MHRTDKEPIGSHSATEARTAAIQSLTLLSRLEQRLTLRIAFLRAIRELCDIALVGTALALFGSMLLIWAIILGG